MQSIDGLDRAFFRRTLQSLCLQYKSIVGNTFKEELRAKAESISDIKEHYC